MDVSTNNVTVRLKPPNCENVDGPIYINFAAKCSLCDQQIIHNNITISYNVSFTIYTISELHPYTDYILLVSASRNKIKHWTKIKSADFKTKPSGMLFSEAGTISTVPIILYLYLITRSSMNKNYKNIFYSC